MKNAVSDNFQRVLYSKNPLETVICQLRFPTILRIDGEVPAAFQDAIRPLYPAYKESRSSENQLPTGIAQLLGGQLPAGLGRSAYEFVSEDGQWQLSLTRDFLALTCRKYKQWEEFKAKLEPAVDALLAEYKPGFISRVGLRYKNVIRRSTLELGDTPWGELLKPYIAGELGDQQAASAISNVAKEILFNLTDAGKVRILHGFVEVEGEQSYLIDSDFFADTRTGTNDVWNVLNGSNTYARRLFRWCIENKLHDAMGPEPLGG